MKRNKSKLWGLLKNRKNPKEVSKLTICFATGGTAGHLFPALEVAKKCKKHDVIFAHDYKSFEKYGHLIEKEGFAQYIVKCSGLTDSPVKNFFNIISLLLGSIKMSFYFLFIKQPDITIGFGGYSSFPATFCSFFLKIPFFLHEQNSIAGKVNHIFANRARQVFTTFPETERIKSGFYTGIPIRDGIANRKRGKAIKRAGGYTVTVIGGSSGATSFAHLVPFAIELLPDGMQDGMMIHHQVDKSYHDELQHLYSNKMFLSDFRLYEFIDVEKIFAESDLVISRCGASVLAELAFFDIPAIMIPYAKAAENHQYYNGLFYEQRGMGIMLQEDEITPNTLCDHIKRLLTTKHRSNLADVCKMNAGAKDRIYKAIRLTPNI